MITPHWSVRRCCVRKKKYQNVVSSNNYIQWPNKVIERCTFRHLQNVNYKLLKDNIRRIYLVLIMCYQNINRSRYQKHFTREISDDIIIKLTDVLYLAS